MRSVKINTFYEMKTINLSPIWFAIYTTYKCSRHLSPPPSLSFPVYPDDKSHITT